MVQADALRVAIAQKGAPTRELIIRRCRFATTDTAPTFHFEAAVPICHIDQRDGPYPLDGLYPLCIQFPLFMGCGWPPGRRRSSKVVGR